MGGNLYMLAASPKEAQAIKDYLGDTENVTVGDSCTWLDWGKRTRLELGYSFGGFGSDLAYFVGREIVKRFNIKKMGADSVGYYPDKDWEFEGERSARDSYGDYTSWVTWLGEYKPAFSEHVQSLDRMHKILDQDADDFSKWEASILNSKDETLKILQALDLGAQEFFENLDKRKGRS